MYSSLSLSIYIYIYTHTYTYIYIYIHIHVCIYIYIYIYIYTHTYIYTCINLAVREADGELGPVVPLSCLCCFFVVSCLSVCVMYWFVHLLFMV